MPRIISLTSPIRHQSTVLSGMCREVCKICYHVNPVGFSVPDEIWMAVVPPEFHNRVICLACFARLADEKLVTWDKNIQLYPVSMATHLGVVSLEPEESGDKRCEQTG